MQPAQPAVGGERTLGAEGISPSSRPGSQKPSSHPDSNRRPSALTNRPDGEGGLEEQLAGEEEFTHQEPYQETMEDWYRKLNLELEDVEYDPVEEKFAFLTLDVSKKNLTSLYNFLIRYPHLREVDTSQNRIDQLNSVTYLPHLTTLKASSNLITSVDFLGKPSVLEFLINAELSKNQIKNLPALSVKRLRYLDLKENLIESCENLNGHPTKSIPIHPTLERLELRKNKLKSAVGLSKMPNLTELYLAQNELVDLSGLHDLPRLKKLHLRDNKQLERLGDVSLLPGLAYINLRDSGFKEKEDVQKLIPFAGLRKISVTGTPFEAEVGDVKTEFLMFLQQLTHLGKDTEEIPPEDKVAALETLKTRRQEEEDRRREEEQRRLEELELQRQQAKDNPADTGDNDGHN